MKNRLYLLIIGLFLSTLSAASLNAQVTIAPTNLFIDSSSKFGTYMVVNNSQVPQEISIDFYYGYNQSDNNGNTVSVKEDEAEGAGEHSVADKVRAFPQNFVLAPGQRQVVRLRISAGNDIADGTRWARIRTRSNAQTPPLELQTTEAVSANVGIVIEQITGLFYKKGTVNTGISIENVRTELSGNNRLSVLTDLKRTGNSPFLGTITTALSNNAGEIVREDRVSTTIYFDGTHKAELDIKDLPAGNYTINVNFASSRPDVSAGDLVQMDEASSTMSYSIN